MTKQIQNQYIPDVVSPPGETLLELLESKRMSQAELADRTGRPKKTINEIVKGKAAITPETALQFERVLGVPASFWISREQGYRESLARAKEAIALENEVDWLDQIPYKALCKLGWVQIRHERSHQVEELLRFFAVASPTSWEDVWRNVATAGFRQSPSFASEPGAVAAWLRRGEIEAAKQDCAEFDKEEFKRALAQVRSLTRDTPRDIASELKSLCNPVGVAVAFVPEIPGTKLWGAARWLSNNCALIQVSLRYKTDDHFWFTFFHEAAHVILHSKREFFLDEDGQDTPQKELEANAFARNWLVPDFKYRQFCRRGAFNCTAAERFAHEIGVSPGIVVGRLQFDGRLDRKFCNQLKREVSWILDQE